MSHSLNDFRNSAQGVFADCVIYAPEAIRHHHLVLTTVELLARLDAKGVRPSEIARALDISPSRVTEIRKGERLVKLDEAARLVAAFDLESPPSQERVPPLPAPIARLIVQYVAMELGCVLEENRGRIGELSEDVRAFAEFVSDPKVRDSLEAAEAFFLAMKLRRPQSAAEAPVESDPDPAR